MTFSQVLSQDTFAGYETLTRSARAFGTTIALHTKHAMNYCKVNHFKNAASKGAISVVCLCCSHPNEAMAHVLVCKNSTRKKLYLELLMKLESWLGKKETDPRLTSMIISYL